MFLLNYFRLLQHSLHFIFYNFLLFNKNGFPDLKEAFVKGKSLLEHKKLRQILESAKWCSEYDPLLVEQGGIWWCSEYDPQLVEQGGIWWCNWCSEYDPQLVEQGGIWWCSRTTTLNL